MKNNYDWMDGDYRPRPKMDAILKFFGLARYSIVQTLEKDIKIITDSESFMWERFKKINK